MDGVSTLSGDQPSDTVSTASPKPKPDFYYVDHPLTSSELVWLRQRKKHVAEVYQRLLLKEAAEKARAAMG